jgi:hypothetical protein
MMMVTQVGVGVEWMSANPASRISFYIVLTFQTNEHIAHINIYFKCILKPTLGRMLAQALGGVRSFLVPVQETR